MLYYANNPFGPDVLKGVIESYNKTVQIIITMLNLFTRTYFMIVDLFVFSTGKPFYNKVSRVFTIFQA